MFHPSPDGRLGGFVVRHGCTRFGSPGLFVEKFGGHGASPTPTTSSRSTHSRQFLPRGVSTAALSPRELAVGQSGLLEPFAAVRVGQILE